MTDLRTAAQAVIDSHVFGQVGHNAIQALRQALAEPVEPVCNPHPDAPHGFNRNASHTEDRYVCDCESWEPPSVDALITEIDGLLVLEEIGFQSAIKISDIKTILDKYRSVK